MAINVERLMKRWDRLVTEHQMWCDMWQQLADYIHPRRSQFFVVRSQGARQTEKLFDSTAIDANDRLANTMNGTLTSRSIKWFGLKVRDESLNENQAVQEWLEESSKRMFRAFNQSNFASEVHENYLDMGAFGTSGLFVEERQPDSKDFKGFVFRALPLHDFQIEEDHEGRVNAVYRRFKMSAAAMVEQWTLAKMGEKVTKAYKEEKSDTIFTVLHAIYPRMDGTETSTVAGTPSTKLPWVSAYLCVEDKHLITEGGFHEFPCMVPRWAKTAGEKYGRGPGHIALPDIKTLNKVTELGLKTWAKNLDMPTKSKRDAIIGPVRNLPGGNTVVDGNLEDIQPLFPPGSFRESIGNDQIKSEALKESIKRIFYADQLNLPTGVPMTATEVLKRFELLQRTLGPTMGRIESEFLNPLIERTFNIMFRRGAFTTPPQELSGQSLDVEYEGPLSKSQRLSEVEAAERWVTFVANGSQLWPEMADNVDYDKAAQISADVLGVPAELLRDPKDVQKLRAQKQQALQQQQAKQDLLTLAQGAGKAAPALKLLTGGGVVPGETGAVPTQ